MDIQDVLIWNDYTAILKANNIRLYDFVDEWVWIRSKFGKYSPKVAYSQLSRIWMMTSSFGGGKWSEYLNSHSIQKKLCVFYFLTKP